MKEINKVKQECGKLMAVLTEDAKKAEQELKNARIIQDDAFEEKSREIKRRQDSEKKFLAL